MKKIVVEIIMMIIVWVGGSLYAYFNTSFGADVWWISAIFVLIIYALCKFVDYRDNKKNKNK